MSARVGVVLSGSGVFDGSEIHEAVSILVALDRRGAAVTCMAPATEQRETIDHLTRKPEKTNRNVLRESARIARGKIVDVATVNADDLDALMFPGGFGVVKNLCTFAADGVKCAVNDHVRRLITDMHAAGKPIGAACIAPVLVARVLGELGAKPRLTIGTDPPTAEAINKMGGQHAETTPAGVVLDEQNRLVSTPCYMNDVGPWVVYQGAEKMVEEVLNLAGDADSVQRRHMATFSGR